MVKLTVRINVILMLEVKFGNDLNKGSYTNFASNSNRIN